MPESELFTGRWWYNLNGCVVMKIISKAVALTAILVFVSLGNAFANDEGLPPDRVISAIQAAVAVNPGLIKEVEVEREGGRLVVEIKMIGTDGRETELKVDPATNQVMR